MLDLLEGLNIDGTPALEILIKTWCENAETFQGFWPPRISTLALCSLLASERPSLQGLIVKGDIIVKPETKNGESSAGCRTSKRCGTEGYLVCATRCYPTLRPVNVVPVGGLVIMTRSRTKQSTPPLLLRVPGSGVVFQGMNGVADVFCCPFYSSDRVHFRAVPREGTQAPSA